MFFIPPTLWFWHATLVKYLKNWTRHEETVKIKRFKGFSHLKQYKNLLPVPFQLKNSGIHFPLCFPFNRAVFFCRCSSWIWKESGRVYEHRRCYHVRLWLFDNSQCHPSLLQERRCDILVNKYTIHILVNVVTTMAHTSPYCTTTSQL